MHDRDPVAEPLRLAHDVRRKHDALALVAQLGHGVQQRPGHEHVEPGRRFVEDQHRRIVDDRPGDRHFLLHAGRHLRAQHVANLVHLQPLEELLHPLAQLVVAHAVQPAEVLDHFPGGHAVVDGRVGRDEANLAADQLGLRDDVEAVDDGRAARGLQHGAENPQGGRLAGAVGPQQAVDLARAGVEADAVERHDLAPPQIGVGLRRGSGLRSWRTGLAEIAGGAAGSDGPSTDSKSLHQLSL